MSTYLRSVREQQQDLGPAQYPYLAPEKRSGMTADEFEEYERKRRDESEARAKAYVFREIVYCIDAETGKTLWQNQSDSVYSRWPQSGSPTVLHGRLYLLGAGRNARCLDATTGADQWMQPLPGEFRDEYYQSSVVYADGVVVLVAEQLFGLQAETGRILWNSDSQIPSGTHSSPVLWSVDGRELLLVNLSGGKTACLDPVTGQQLWQIQSEGGQSTPVVSGNSLITYGNSRQKGLRCFRLTLDGAEEAWVYQRIQDKGSSPVIVDGYVYVQGEKRLACLDLQSGEAAWTASLNLPSPQYTSLIATPSQVLYAYDGLLAFRATPAAYEPLYMAKFHKSGLMAEEPTLRQMLRLDEIEKQPDGLEKSLKLMQREVGSQGPLRCASPALTDGRLYLRMNDAIACYDLREPSAITQ